MAKSVATKSWSLLESGGRLYSDGGEPSWNIPATTYTLPVAWTEGTGGSIPLSAYVSNPSSAATTYAIESGGGTGISVNASTGLLTVGGTATAGAYSAVVSLNGGAQRTFGFTVAAATYSPLWAENFDGYANGAALGNNVVFAGGSRTVADTSIRYGGSGASAKMSVRTGDGPSTFVWGGIKNLPRNFVRGEELWVRWRQYWPSSMQFTATPMMKFLRLSMQNAGANAGYMDLYIDNADGPYPVYRSIREFSNNNIWALWGSTAIPRDQWITYEVYCKFDVKASMGGSGVLYRVWIDGQLVQSRDATDTGTMNAVGDVCSAVYWFTYWNNETPPDNDCYVDDIVIASHLSPPTNTDAGGNFFIGT